MDNYLENQRMRVSSVLNPEEMGEVSSFFKKMNFQPHYNNPFWTSWVEPYKKPLYIRFYENSEISAFAIVYTRMSFCALKFGPICRNNIRIYDYVNEIANYLQKQDFGLLTIQLPFGLKEIPDSLMNSIKKDRKMYFEDQGWNTILISLEGKGHEDIFKEFSKGHKSAIKKAIKSGLVVRMIETKTQLDRFSEIYDEMHLRKNLIPSLPDSHSAFNSIFDLHLGIFLGVYKTDELIGGVLFISEGDTLLYKFGASDVRYYDIPVLHLAIFEMIKYGIETNHKKVDLGGYDARAKSGTYSFGINTFKKGFGGDRVEFIPALSVRLNFFKLLILRVIVFASTLLPERIKRMFY